MSNNKLYGAFRRCYRKNRRYPEIMICVCRCFNVIEIYIDDLESGKVVNCGCGAIPRNRSQSALDIIIDTYCRSAKSRDILFELTAIEVYRMITAPCYYCGRVSYSKTKDIRHNGIDRIDSNVGYVLNNCVPCCGVCNSMKGTLTDYDFIQQCKRISNHTKEY